MRLTPACFQVTGEAVSTPKIPWATADKVNVTVAFTFDPVPSS